MKALSLRCSMTLGLLLLGCGSDAPESPADHIGAVQGHLNEDKLDEAVTTADVALGEVDAASGAGLELQGQRLEAMARQRISKETAEADPGARERLTQEVTALLKDLHTTYPQQFGYEEFLIVGAWLAQAGDCTGAVDLLAYGDEIFTEKHAIFEEAVLSAGSLCGSGGDDEMLQQLQSLGYI